MVKILKLVVSLAVVFGLAVAANKLSKINTHIEFPIWAALLGVVVGNIPFISQWFKGAAKTEFFIKVGLVLLGASVNFSVMMSVGARGIAQAIIGVPIVFFFAWYVAKWFGLEAKMRAVLATAASICGVSAAIASASSILAKKEDLTYVVALVVIFALPLMIIIPWLAELMHLSPAVAGAWMGNNIDTTAAVTGASEIFGHNAVKVASVVKMGQNVLIGVVAFLLALYFALKVERKPGMKPKPIEIWNRFPKFVLGFVVVSALVSLGIFAPADVKLLDGLRKWFFCFAFVCIGMGFNFREMRQVGGKPLAVFAIVTVFNTFTALGLSFLFFNDYNI